MRKIIQQYGHIVLGIFVSFVFIQSLYFKFSNSPETKYIFDEKLNVWAGTLGFEGIFASGGIFAATHIGAAELIASLLIILGVIFRKRLVEAFGAFLGFYIMSGALSFHLFTPLGISVKNADGTFDGGQLFILAVIVWISCATLIYIRRKELLSVFVKYK